MNANPHGSIRPEIYFELCPHLYTQTSCLLDLLCEKSVTLCCFIIELIVLLTAYIPNKQYNVCGIMIQYTILNIS